MITTPTAPPHVPSASVQRSNPVADVKPSTPATMFELGTEPGEEEVLLPGFSMMPQQLVLDLFA